MYVIYTDGATTKNGSINSKGGYGYIILHNDEIIYQEYGPVKGTKEKSVTNNICELTAVLLALNKLLYLNPLVRSDRLHVKLYSDSAYFVNCINKQWYTKWRENGWITTTFRPVENRALWEDILDIITSLDIEIKKVKGHAGSKYNEMVDALARQGVEYAKTLSD